MTSTIHDQKAEPNVNPAVPPLIQRLKTLGARYTRACEDGERGYSFFLLLRMEEASKRINELVSESIGYATITHAVTHAPHPFADSDSGLTACFHVGPIGTEPTCETCAGHSVSQGAA